MGKRSNIKVNRLLSFIVVLVFGITAVGASNKVQVCYANTVYASSSMESTINGLIDDGEYSKVIKVYNKKISGKTKQEAKIDPIIAAEINSIELDWTSGKADYETTTEALTTLKKISNEKLSEQAKNTRRFVAIEHRGNICYTKAEKHFSNGEFFKSLKYIMKIDKSYSSYSSAVEFKEQCEEILDTLISSPTTEKEYAQCEKRVDKYLEVDPEAQCFIDRKKELSRQRADFNNAEPFLKKARKAFKNEEYKKSFTSLGAGLEEYPDNMFLKDTKEEYQNLFVVGTVQKVNRTIRVKKGHEKVEKEQYDKAKGIINNAIDIYPCEEFDAIKAYISERQYWAIGAAHNVRDALIEKYDSIKNKIASGEINKETATKQAKAYVTQSGEKLVLGDYSEEEITILSAGGEIMTSLLGVDAAIDVRDLSYDLTHWGEEDYFAVRLATDVVALVPVVGAVKYLKYSKEVGKGVKGGVKTAKGVIGGTTDAAKRTNKILNKATDVASNSKQSEKIANVALAHYKKIDTINASLAKQKHPVTGVLFDEKKIEAPDGTKLIGVFAQFDSKASVTVPTYLYGATNKEQNAYLIKALQKQANSGKLNDSFDTEQLNVIKGGSIPKGYKWYKSEANGVMQLVDRNTLKKTECTDGSIIWGSESKYIDSVKANVKASAKPVYKTKEWQGYGNQNYSRNEYRIIDGDVVKYRCNRHKFFNGDENEWVEDEQFVESWSIDDSTMPEWLWDKIHMSN